MRLHSPSRFLLRAAVLVAALALIPEASAHCDSLDGPVVADARRALETGDLAPVLKWVAPHDEAEVAAAFERARRVRAGSAEAAELADLYFFETAVRLHRASEGMPYTGLKPAGADLGPVIPAADAALASGSADELARLLTDEMQAGLRERFARALEARAHADHNAEAGRAFVRAYVAFTHFAEHVHEAAAVADAHAGPPAAEHAAPAGHVH